MPPPPRYVQILNPCSVALFGKRVFVVVNKNLEMRSSGFEVDPKSNARYPCKRKAEGDQRPRDTGRRPGGQSFALSSRGARGVTGSWKRPGGSLMEPLKRAQPCSHLDLGLVSFRTGREYICVISSHLMYENLFRQP